MTLNRRTFFGAATLGSMAVAAPAFLRLGSDARAQSAPETTRPVVMRRKIGDIEVFALMDGFGVFPTQMFAGFDPEAGKAAAALAHRPFDAASFAIAINANLIKTKGRIIAVDSGAPSAMGPTVGGWARTLAAVGVAPEQVDTMFVTHIHADHVGGLTDPANGAKVLPNATFVASETEWNFVHDDVFYAQVPKDFQGYWDVSRAMVKPYDGVKSLIQPGAEIAPGLTTVALPGHTPGHLGLRIDSGTESLLIWGDIIHGTSFQFTRPDWSFALDVDAAMAVQTRKSALDMVAADGMMVAGMHLDFPGFGYVERAGEAYRFTAAPYNYRG